jgi:iduronate 2-sulfatase
MRNPPPAVSGRPLIALVAVLLSTQTASRKAAMEVATDERPSVLLLFTPGLGDRLGRDGERRSPNLERLVAEGRLFQRAYAPYPSSEASRVSVMTGRRPETLGVFGPPEATALASAVTLQRRFQASGYRTIRVGPVFGGDAESEQRWDVVEAGGEDAGRRVAALLATNRAERFFMTATLGETHVELPPIVASPDGPTLPELPAISIRAGRVDGPGRLARPPGLLPGARRALVATFDARIDRVDAQIGEVLDALDRLGLRGRVVVAVVSDSGPDLGIHGAVPREDLLFDQRLRASLIVTSPDLVEPGVPTPALVDLVDVYPTLLELCGLPGPAHGDGRSLMAPLRDPWATGRRAAFSVAERDAGYVGMSLRTRRYRYTRWPDGSEELYDHDADPNEWTNLARGPKPSAFGILADMRRRLDDHEADSAPPPARLAPSTPVPRRPNVLFILLDDLTVRLGCYGYPDVKTPNIDRLAGMGRRFDRAYAQVAMCSPSRTSLLTGWRPERVDLWTNALAPRPKVPGAVPLEELFHANGYFTARIGKVYHGPWESEFRWDLAESLPPSVAGAVASEDDESETDVAEDGASSSWWRVTDDSARDEPDGIRARRVAQLLGEHRTRPIFIGLGFAKPHLRWTAPRKYFDLYRPESLHVETPPRDDLADVPLIALTHHQPIPSPGLTAAGRELDLDETARRQALAAYYACVSFVDAQVGVVLDALDRNHLWDDTVVVLLGDHGYHLGEHGLWRKDTLFEAALRTPLIVVAPGMPHPGVGAREVVEFLDLYPTLAELAGLGLPAGIEGRSLVALLEDPEALESGEAFSFRGCTPPRLGRSVRTGRYRFTEWPDGSRELYDVARDPDELRNLAADPGSAPLVDRLKHLLDAGPAAPEP